MTEETRCPHCGLVDPDACGSLDNDMECPHALPELKSEVIQSGPLAGLRRCHYGAIYADPPWSFLTRSDKGKDRSPENHYDCMTLDEIKALPVHELAAKDCALFMWTIDTHLPMALDVISAWGFTFKTKAFNWVKLNRGYDELPRLSKRADMDMPYFKGMGFWTRANPEDCLLATTGAPKRQSKSVRRLIVAKVREHSRKPEEARERIEELVPGPYVELFSRSGRPGWDAMGNEVGKFDRLAAPEPEDEDDGMDLI